MTHRVSATPPDPMRWRNCCEHVDSDDHNEEEGCAGDFHNQDDGDCSQSCDRTLGCGGA